MSVKNIYEGLDIKKLACVGHYQKRVGTRLRNLKKKQKGIGGRVRLNNVTIDRLQNFGGVTIRQTKGNLEKMKSSPLASLFHAVCNKDNILHFAHGPTGPGSCCKFNADKVNKTNVYNPEPKLPNDVIYKIRPIYFELSKEVN